MVERAYINDIAALTALRLEFLQEEEVNTIENINLYHVLNDLEVLDMKLIIYKFIYGFNNTEISKIFGCCSQTVARKINKALEVMRNKLRTE